MNEVVLDASALLALLQGEPGAEVVASRLDAAIMSTVNHSEVVAKLADAGMPEAAIREALSLPLRLVDFDAVLSIGAGILRAKTRHLGLSLGDRACLALALDRDAPALTADATWAEVPGGPKVEMVRAHARPKPKSKARPARSRR